MFRKALCIALGLLALPLTGCWEFELFSWSPDGRYVVVVDENEGHVWRWDTVKQQPAPLSGLQGADIVRFSYASNGEAFVLGSNLQLSGFFAPEVDSLVKFDMKGGGLFEVSPGANVEWFTVSPDGRQIATVAPEGKDEDQRSIVAVAPTDHLDKRRVLGEFKEEVVTWAFDNSGTRLLLTRALPEEELPEGVEEDAELVLLEFGTDTVTTKSFAKSIDETPMGARFVGDDAFVYNRFPQDQPDDDQPISTVMFQRLDGSEPELLHDAGFGLFPASVSPDGKTVVITVTTDQSVDWDDLMQSSIQLMSIDIESRKKTVITDEAFGAYAGKYDPNKNRIAYATGSDPFCAKILDLDTGHVQLVWRDDEERLFVTAEHLIESGDTGMALAYLDDLLNRFPETKFRSRTAYLRMKLHLASPFDEFDEAVDAFLHIRHGELIAQARPLLWEHVDAHATDLRGDLIRTYKTDASTAEFERDTDRTRDLTDLEARATADKLYLRIGYDSSYDLGGSVFADTILLFHEVGSNEGMHTVTPNVEWEFPATRTVIIRHWFKDGQVYDLEVLDETGKNIARYVANRIAEPNYPAFDVFDLIVNPNDGGGAIACWLDRRAIGLRAERDYELQVVTVKGGIETYKGLERPREESGWDIADAFDDANTKTRIDAEENPKLLGFAVKVRIPREREE